jgi:3-isopropylmalate/(R)-2-methylmalate dehydratase large subunit
MGQNIVDKIFEKNINDMTKTAEMSLLKVDQVMVQDGAANLVIDQFNSLKADLLDSEKYTFIIDHSSPSPIKGISDIHQKMRLFCKQHNITIHDVGAGICHQLMLETGRVLPGTIVVGGEAHSCMYGAANSLGLPVGSTDISSVMATGALWLIKPKVVNVELKGSLQKEISAKDLAFHIISIINTEFLKFNNFVIEYSGDGITNLDMSSRMTVCNMATSMGAISAIMPFDDCTASWAAENVSSVFEPVYSDKDAIYDGDVTINLEEVNNMIALPGNISRIDYLSKIKDIKIDQAIIGTCSSGQVSDYEKAAKVMKGKKVKARVLIVMSSVKIYKELIKKGIIEIFLESGATILPPGCGPCVGSLMGIVSDDEIVISTSNRNYKGIMGGINSKVYLASPEIVATSAVTGEICRSLK